MPDLPRILHLEDDSADAELIRLRLIKDNFPAQIIWVEDHLGFINALKQQRFDLILADYRLRSFDGFEALQITLRQSPGTPFIFVSGMLGEERAIDSLKEGATDYVLKNQLARLVPALRRAMHESKGRQARKKADEQLQAFSRLGRRLCSASSPKEVALIVGSIANELFGWDAFTLDLYSSESDATQTRLKLDAINRQQPDIELIKIDIKTGPLSRWVMESGAELISPEESAPRTSEEIPVDGPPRPSGSIMRVAIKHKNQGIGVLSLHSQTPKAYDESDLSALQSLADYCAGALERMRAEEKVALLSMQFLDAARHAGMEEAANNVLHNVGNVLNSVNVSATLVTDKLINSKLAGLSRASELLRAHAQNLGGFLTEDPQGKHLPDYLETLANYWESEQTTALKELQTLNKNINHIKDIVSRQQSLTGTSAIAEPVFISELVEDALAIAASDLERIGIIIEREYTMDSPVLIDKMRLMLILVNLIGNARDALMASVTKDKRLKVRTESHKSRHLRVLVIDNGIGIAPENLGKILTHGFTTKERGHGFGLHGSALAARELGGSLTADSEGLGRGARFAVEIVLKPGFNMEVAP